MLGWELTMSSYSYCVETSRGATVASLRECLFFLFVNPTLVYTVRGRPLSGPGGYRGLARACVGAAVMLFDFEVLIPMARNLRHTSPLSWLQAGALQTLALCGLVQFFAVYAAHSSLAHIQIGIMRHLGWEVPERYSVPILAKSPMDFWRRWNTYVRVWLEAYLFLPLAQRMARTNTGRWGQAGAAIATLLASGLLHDACAFAGSQQWKPTMTTFFLSACVLLAAWRGAAWLAEIVRRRLNLTESRGFDLAARWSGYLSLAGALVTAAVVWGR
jgi:hypothetical protein